MITIICAINLIICFELLLDKMLHKSQCVPKEILFNIAKIFMIYRDGVNIENYIFIYYVS